MSDQDVLVQYYIINAGDMSANITSSAVSIAHLDNLAVEVSISGAGTANGTVAVQVSSSHVQDTQGNVVTAGTWNSISLTPSTTIVNGSPSSWFINLSEINAPWIRVIYTESSGSGTMNAYISGKKI